MVVRARCGFANSAPDAVRRAPCYCALLAALPGVGKSVRDASLEVAGALVRGRLYYFTGSSVGSRAECRNQDRGPALWQRCTAPGGRDYDCAAARDRLTRV